MTSESLSPEKDEVENGPDPQLSPRQLSDGFGSFDDDDSLSLNFGNNKREKSKPVSFQTYVPVRSARLLQTGTRFFPVNVHTGKFCRNDKLNVQTGAMLNFLKV